MAAAGSVGQSRDKGLLRRLLSFRGLALPGRGFDSRVRITRQMLHLVVDQMMRRGSWMTSDCHASERACWRRARRATSRRSSGGRGTRDQIGMHRCVVDRHRAALGNAVQDDLVRAHGVENGTDILGAILPDFQIRASDAKGPCPAPDKADDDHAPNVEGRDSRRPRDALLMRPEAGQRALRSPARTPSNVTPRSEEDGSGTSEMLKRANA